MLPMSVPAVAKRRRFLPDKGPLFSNDGTSAIRIDIHSPNALLDAHHSYLEFEFENQGLPGGAITFGLDIGGGNVFLDKIEGWYALNTTMETPEYGANSSKAPSPSSEGVSVEITSAADASSSWVSAKYQVRFSIVYDNEQESLVYIPQTNNKFKVA